MIREDWGHYHPSHHPEPHGYDYRSHHHNNARHSTASFYPFHRPFTMGPPYSYNVRSPVRPFHGPQPESPYPDASYEPHPQEIPGRFRYQDHVHSVETVKNDGSHPDELKRKLDDAPTENRLMPSPVESRAKRARLEKDSDSPILLDSPDIAIIPSLTDSENHMENSVATMPDFENDCYEEEYANTRHPYYFSQHSPYHPMSFGTVHPSEIPQTFDQNEPVERDRKLAAARDHMEDIPEEPRDAYQSTPLGPSQKEIEDAGPQRAVNALKVWYQRLNELVEFKHRHGHCNVRQKYKENPALGIWVNKQRCSRESLSEEKHQVLESINFDWGSKKGEEAWTIKFQQLLEYNARFGNCK
mmetsp:Transcript_7526/g.11788  ORF Transcript_7526/g.11788 Transcript_7526/m.11788 type:complete len:357 (+) Transcript_7526:59-1129(+)|eukprot:CAMPEP_0194264604 /NCGR_PEP_ID=MMETSP0158-20130606/47670_1 /TAXON_ID=33649 /ORGANISM="Thalassionema nitzschioides, Strain L26-B" /LENGTH=356 /DNA_ID=CAMNT_0039004849 /DNA_START=41 /DNA_END=1111 /DNA_ORIENTATION=+